MYDSDDLNDFLTINQKTIYRRSDPIKTNYYHYNDNNIDDGMMINFPYYNIRYTYTSPASEIPLSRNFKRAGVIPYTIIDDVKYFCLGVDSRYGTLTDFGGQAKKYETFTKTASRELLEESLGIFNLSSSGLYKYSKAVYNKDMIILFIRLNLESFDKYKKEFSQRFKKSLVSENSDIMLIDEITFCNIIKTGKCFKTNNMVYPSLYKPVLDLLKTTINGNYLG